MKKLLVILVTLSLCLSSVAAAEYDTHVSFTINSTHSNAAQEYADDELYRYISEKFNFSYEVFPVAKESQSEKIRIWINGGTMPDTVTWRDFDYQEYALYAEQGLLRALPQGWEQTYPALYEMVMKTGIGDRIYVDGNAYGVPHAIFARYGKMDTVVNHLSVYYRKDWVEQLGLEPFGTVVSLSQLQEYLRLAIEKDMAGNGNTLGLACDPAYFNEYLMTFSKVDYNGFYRSETGYCYGAAQPSVLSCIQAAHEWYQKGYVDPDYYLNTLSDIGNKYASGLAAAMLNAGAVNALHGFKINFETSSNKDPMECVGFATLSDDQGTTYAVEASNAWSVTMFSPTIEEETFLRILDLMDWLCTEEGQLTAMMGVPGVDWELNEDGSVKPLNAITENGNYPNASELYKSYSVFRSLGILPDDFAFVNPSYAKDVTQRVLDVYAAKQAGSIIPYDYDYSYFTSDAKAMYSIDLDDEITRLIISDNLDIEAEWNAFIESNRGIWEPVVDDLNKAFYNN